jgi:hypothetical protein
MFSIYKPLLLKGYLYTITLWINFGPKKNHCLNWDIFYQVNFFKQKIFF